MISQSLYRTLCGFMPPLNYEEFIKDGLDQFIKPRVLVIHWPSGRGFYLDQQYRHIVDVSDCQEPENPTDVEKESFCTRFPPDWTYAEKSKEFDSFWLY